MSMDNFYILGEINSSSFVITITFIAIIFSILKKSICIVPKGYEYIIEKFGEYSKTLKPGLSLITPLICNVRKKVNMQKQVLDIPSQEAITKDKRVVTVNGIAFYQVFDAKNSAYEVNNHEYGLLRLLLTNIRTDISLVNFSDLYQDEEIERQILRSIKKETNKWGVNVLNLKIDIVI